MDSASARDWVAVTSASLSADSLTDWVSRPECGATVTFSGTVRNFSATHDDVRALEYETNPQWAEARIGDIVSSARAQWPTLGSIAVHHRIGRVELEEAAVVVAVSAPHRDEAFAAAQFCIDTLKESVPMWKLECWDGGSSWSVDTHPLRGVNE